MVTFGSGRSGRGRQNQQQRLDSSSTAWWWRRRRNNLLLRRLASPRIFRCFLICLAFIALVPPLFFHFKLRRFHQIQLRKCSWINDPPLVCAHGGDSTNAFPNTMTAYLDALRSQVDCIEIDISRSSDGELFALHDRDLQRLSGNYTSRVGHLSMKEIKELNAITQSTVKFQDQNIPTMEEALMMISNSVRRVILDIKVGPPLFEKGLAKDILSIVERTNCQNCIVWCKNDNLGRDVIRQSANEMLVGYIVMIDPSTGIRNNILRMKGAGVVGIYHPLIDEKLVRVLHGRNKEIYAWTVDDRESMERMLFEHVDGVVTSDPSQLQSLMDEIRTDCLEDGFSITH